MLHGKITPIFLLARYRGKGYLARVDSDFQANKQSPPCSAEASQKSTMPLFHSFTLLAVLQAQELVSPKLLQALRQQQQPTDTLVTMGVINA